MSSYQFEPRVIRVYLQRFAVSGLVGQELPNCLFYALPFRCGSLASWQVLLTSPFESSSFSKVCGAKMWNKQKKKQKRRWKKKTRNLENWLSLPEQWETRKHLYLYISQTFQVYWTAYKDLLKKMVIMYDIQERVFQASVNDLCNKMLGSRLDVIGS